MSDTRRGISMWPARVQIFRLSTIFSAGNQLFVMTTFSNFLCMRYYTVKVSKRKNWKQNRKWLSFNKVNCFMLAVDYAYRQSGVDSCVQFDRP